MAKNEELDREIQKAWDEFCGDHPNLDILRIKSMDDKRLLFKAGFVRGQAEALKGVLAIGAEAAGAVGGPRMAD